MAQRRISRRTTDLGSIYRGREGQWSWLAHRITGVAVILFLFAHVVDTAVVGWGPAAYNRVIAVYRNPVVTILELGLVTAVIYHALNGIRIMIIDFWPKACDWNRQLTIAMMTLFVGGMVPIAVIMLIHAAHEIH